MEEQYTDTMKLCVARKNNEMAFAGKWVELRIILNEVSLPRSRKQIHALCVGEHMCAGARETMG